MSTFHASQLRAEVKHASRHRQLRRDTPIAPPAFSRIPVRRYAGPIWLLLTVALLLLPIAASAAEPTLPDDVRAAELMETSLFARNAGPEDMRKMERIYADLVAKYPKDAAVKNVQGEFFWNINDHQRAVEAWLAAEKLDPNNAAVLDHLGGSFLAAGDPRKAAGYFTRALASAPDNAFYHFNYANVAYLFRHDLLDPKTPDANAVLRLALSHFAEASRLEPLNPEFARAYAETFYTIPDPNWRTALQAWQRFYDITPNKDSALLNLARVHLKLGNKTEARETLARIQSPQFDRIKNKMQEGIDTK